MQDIQVCLIVLKQRVEISGNLGFRIFKITVVTTEMEVLRIP